MRKFLFLAVGIVITGLAIPTSAFAGTIIMDASPYTPPATSINYSNSGGGSKVLYFNSGSLPICDSGASGYGGSGEINAFCTNFSGSFDNTVEGDYQFINENSTLCAALSYAACEAANPDGVGGNGLGEFTIGTGGAGGGGGSIDIAATSTLEQSQTNLFNGFLVFFVSMFGMIWLLRPRGR